jgi:N-acetyl-gamma-glutamyl-phosphate reductase
MTDVAIMGATGYGGVELIRLLHAHPQVRLSYLSSDTYAGERVCDVYPHLAGVELPLQARDPAAAGRCDFVLLAVPAGGAMEIVPGLLDAGARVVDVSPDFRLQEAALYPRWYALGHTCPNLLREAAFGIPEWHREEIGSARLVAAPGCYPTGALLALCPLVAEGLIETHDIIVDGKTGISGAGRTSLQVDYHFPEAEADVAAYRVGGHRHLPEMVQELSRLTESEVRITFTPHLVPMSRGILLTIYAVPKAGAGADELRDCLRGRYQGEPFVHVLPEGKWPHTKWATGTNDCFLAVGIDETTGRAVAVSVLDNLGKGMAGQMVQCLNLMMGVEEATGLGLPAAYP